MPKVAMFGNAEKNPSGFEHLTPDILFRPSTKRSLLALKL
jgi:hypothetical protein